MKTMPLFIRITGGILLGALILASCALPMYTRGESAAMVGLGLLGKPYVLGHAGPEKYDCSGLTKVAYEALGTELMHSAKYVGYDDQYETVEKASDLVPGDLIFFDTVSDSDKCDHVGIWLGMNRFVHASSSEEVVMISEFDERWQERYSWGKHILTIY